VDVDGIREELPDLRRRQALSTASASPARKSSSSASFERVPGERGFRDEPRVEELPRRPREDPSGLVLAFSIAFRSRSSIFGLTSRRNRPRDPFKKAARPGAIWVNDEELKNPAMQRTSSATAIAGIRR
jgi:hypothetical protein